MNVFKHINVLFMAQAAMIAAIYVVVTLVVAPFAYGEVQVRISEALTILPVFTPAAVPGVFLGCLISNILGGCILPDIIFGSLATLIGAVFTRTLRNKSIIDVAYPDNSGAHRNSAALKPQVSGTIHIFMMVQYHFSCIFRDILLQHMISVYNMLFHDLHLRAA